MSCCLSCVLFLSSAHIIQYGRRIAASDLALALCAAPCAVILARAWQLKSIVRPLPCHVHRRRRPGIRARARDRPSPTQPQKWPHFSGSPSADVGVPRAEVLRRVWARGLGAGGSAQMPHASKPYFVKFSLPPARAQAAQLRPCMPIGAGGGERCRAISAGCGGVEHVDHRTLVVGALFCAFGSETEDPSDGGTEVHGKTQIGCLLQMK